MVHMHSVRRMIRIAIVSSVLVTIGTTATASAHGVDSHTSGSVAVAVPIDTDQVEQMKVDAQQRATEAKERVEKARTEVEQRRAELKARKESRLTDVKQRICERRKTTVTNILNRIDKRGYRHIEVIDRISERTQAYYKEHALVVADYPTLVANIATTKATADSAAAAVKDAQADFACDSGDPKGASGGFDDLVQARAAAVKAYRDAVKALVVAVKAAAHE